MAPRDLALCLSDLTSWYPALSQSTPVSCSFWKDQAQSHEALELAVNAAWTAVPVSFRKACLTTLMRAWERAQPLSCGDPRFLCPCDFPTWVGCYFLLQGIFLTRGSNPRLLGLLHWQVGSLPLSHLGILASLHQSLYHHPNRCFPFRLSPHSRTELHEAWIFVESMVVPISWNMTDFW